MNNILVAGATGYLGKYITNELSEQGYYTRVLVRNPEKFKQYQIPVDGVIHAQVTDKSSIQDCCKNIDVVISSIGITKQKDGLTYMDVDYQANLNLLDEVKRSGVKKFIYVSVLNGEKLRNLKICEAKERFVEELKNSGLEYCIIRPNGFFSDMVEFYNMANKGKVYLFGSGEQKANPIHGEDLAKVCVSAIAGKDKEIEVGGPETLTQTDITNIAFEVVERKPKIVHIPDWVRRTILTIGKPIMGSKKFGPIEFFMNVMAIDMVAPEYGEHTLKNYFNELRQR
ncbi:MAG: SDR family oxidoreductase [Ignavibacterium sp.]|nr:MAG: SDR family oxidoreductase [Ignavibacterium sp.]